MEEIAKRMWEKYFGDDRYFLDKYFSTYYEPQNLIINPLRVEEEFIYMALIIRYDYKYYDNIIPIGYITAVLTHPKERNKGYFKLSMQEAFRSLYNQGYILSCLIPATEDLFKTYLRYGYSNSFSEKKDNNKSILHNDKTFKLYTELGYDITLLKPNKNGLLRIIDVKKVLELYAKENKEISIIYNVEDSYIEENNGAFLINEGLVQCIDNSKQFNNIMLREISISDLASLIFSGSYMDLMFDK